MSSAQQNITMVCDRKVSKRWVRDYEATNADHAMMMYSSHLYDKYIAHAPYIKRVTDKNNYDGTRTITFYMGDYRTVYTVKR